MNVTDPTNAFLLFAAGLLAYAFVRNRLSAFVQPIRVDAVRRGKVLLTDHRLSESAKASVTVSVCDAYNPFIPFLVVAAVPICALLVLLRVKRPVANYGMTDKALVAKIDSVGMHVLLAHMLSSPILFPIFIAELAAAILLFAIVGGNYFALRNLLIFAESLTFRKQLAAA